MGAGGGGFLLEAAMSTKNNTAVRIKNLAKLAANDPDVSDAENSRHPERLRSLYISRVQGRAGRRLRALKARSRD